MRIQVTSGILTALLLSGCATNAHLLRDSYSGRPLNERQEKFDAMKVRLEEERIFVGEKKLEPEDLLTYYKETGDLRSYRRAKTNWILMGIAIATSIAGGIEAVRQSGGPSGIPTPTAPLFVAVYGIPLYFIAAPSTRAKHVATFNAYLCDELQLTSCLD